MLRKTSSGVLFCALFLLPLLAKTTPVFINEIHYDNPGADKHEAVELAGTAGTDLSGWQLIFYNGATGTDYKTVELAGTFMDEASGFGFISFNVPGIQNGAPDGIALVDASDLVSQFISYEGEFEALSGLAEGLMSEDIGVAEPATLPGYSLQLAGQLTGQLTGGGTHYRDFYWTLGAESFGGLNPGQAFSAHSVSVSAIPNVPVVLLMLPLLLWMVRRTLNNSSAF